MKKVKVSRLITAIKKDKIPWHKGGWFAKGYNDDGDYGVIGACVLGVGCINLGIGNAFYGDANYNYASSEFGTAINEIVRYNDSRDGAKTWEEARDYAIEKLTPLKDEVIYATAMNYDVIAAKEN